MSRDPCAKFLKFSCSAGFVPFLVKFWAFQQKGKNGPKNENSNDLALAFLTFWPNLVFIVRKLKKEDRFLVIFLKPYLKFSSSIETPIFLGHFGIWIEH